ncbi:hypothetical protein Q1695_009288 [Nippostrongylus brasiliensis]|nr:hypothetical protein Q1695_009288 [Nippostrongylus brasiliensis]
MSMPVETADPSRKSREPEVVLEKITKLSVAEDRTNISNIENARLRKAQLEKRREEIAVHRMDGECLSRTRAVDNEEAEQDGGVFQSRRKRHSRARETPYSRAGQAGGSSDDDDDDDDDESEICESLGSHMSCAENAIVRVFPLTSDA